MKNNWQIKDLLDLEFFLRQKFDPLPDRADADESRPDRIAPEEEDFDREVFLSFPDHGQWRDTPAWRRSLLKYWLDQRRRHEPGEKERALPGEFFAEAMRIFVPLLALVAFAAGAVISWSLLTYRGQAPVNVFTFLWVLVVLQVLLLLLLGLSLVFSRTGLIRSFNVGYPLLVMALRGLAGKIGRFAGKRLGAAGKNRLGEVYGLLGKAGTAYGSVFFWPIFILAQMLGVFFNLGVMGALLLKVAVTDLAFGWQTTLRLSPETLGRLVEIVAMPWAWFLPEHAAHPTVLQIEGSRMVLKDGMIHLATGDLVSWWPFLFMCVFVYAFLPRLALAGAGLFLYRRAMAAVDFAQGACDRLITRMTTPVLDTRGRPWRDCLPGEAKPDISWYDPTGDPGNKRFFPNQADQSVSGLMPAVVLVAEEIFDNIDKAELDRQLAGRLGLSRLTLLPLEFEAAADAGRLRQALPVGRDKDGSARVVIIQEAWQPPIKENLALIRALRVDAGRTGMIVALVGKPVSGNILTPPAEIDARVWRQAVNSLGDMRLRVESLGNHR